MPAEARLATVRRAAPEAPADNSVLAALPHAAYQRLRPVLEPVTLRFGEVLHEPGAPIRHVYFPVDCVVCLLTRTGGQRTTATGLVGHEGMVGIALALGANVSSIRALVQASGTAMRMAAARFHDELRRCAELQRELQRCAYLKMVLARQTTACVASHLLEQRLACWLLMSSDRSRSAEILLTQEYLAAVLNVRRVSVTMASAALRERGLISYSRGNISIRHRAGLESASCACYRRIEVPHPANGEPA